MVKQKYTIGILGLAMQSPNHIGGNLGCFALGYSFLEIVNRIAAQNDTHIRIIQIKSIGVKGFLKQIVTKIIGYKNEISEYYSSLYDHLEISSGYAVNWHGRTFFMSGLLQCGCVFDFTAGDSFTDLYGEKRFYDRTSLKKKIIDSNIPLVLGSQTIGPFKNPNVQKYAVDVIERCKAVFVRDCISKQYVEEISRVTPILTTDVAFFLPYKKKFKNNAQKKVGFNPSGLLWMGGYTGDNQFGLTVDYQEYCKMTIKHLIGQGYEIHLILHAYSPVEKVGAYRADNDKLAVDTLHKLYPTTVVSPFFATPMEAKSYISEMDLFIGARMHATIAAISSGTPVIPFSYSRKFEGLFDGLDYPYVVEGTKWSTVRATQKTKEWISNIVELKDKVDKCQMLVDKKNEILLKEYEQVLRNCEK